MSSRNRRRELFKSEFVWASRGTATISREDLVFRKALIPMDTRDLTARLCGDPIPGDKRRVLFPGRDDWAAHR